MPQFDAESVVDPIKVRLHPYVEGFDVIVAEPSDRQIGDFLAGLKKLFADAKKDLGVSEDIDVTDAAQILAALDALEPEKYVEFQDSIAGLHADLCSGSPSKAQILAVPFRKRQPLYEFLQSEVMSPEVVPPVGSGQGSLPALRAAV